MRSPLNILLFKGVPVHLRPQGPVQVLRQTPLNPQGHPAPPGHPVQGQLPPAVMRQGVIQQTFPQRYPSGPMGVRSIPGKIPGVYFFSKVKFF